MSISEKKIVRFLRLNAGHIETLLEIENEAYPDPWKHGMFRQEITNPTSFFCVVYMNGELAGYGGFWLMLDEAHITKVTIAQEFRRQGIGLELMRHLLREAIRQGANVARLEVREANLAARTLYEGLGFQEVGLRKGYYIKTNETAVVMVKTLDRPY